jgi:uncharacterized RmlC-like cupin family protein
MEQLPRVIRPDEVSTETAQTPGLIRHSAIDENLTGATRIWMGPASDMGGPKRSGCHSHGEAETAVYCISGRQRVYYGKDFKEFIEFGAGDFAYIPANLPHIEANEWEEPCVCIVTRSPRNIVINLDENEVSGS